MPANVNQLHGLHSRPASILRIYILWEHLEQLFYTVDIPGERPINFSDIGHCVPTVIRNLPSAIPHIGIDLVQSVWGGYGLDNTIRLLNRFFIFYFLLTFIRTA